MFGTISTAFAALVFAGTVAADTVVFRGFDPLWEALTVVTEHAGEYFMDGDAMDVLRHPNMPSEGLSLALRDRIGAPDNYFLIRDGRMDVYTNCEFGPCRKKRTISGQ